MAAQELKRFTISTENVVCAYLNRWSWNNSIKSRRNLKGEKSSEVGDSDSSNHPSGSAVTSSGVVQASGEQVQSPTNEHGQLNAFVTPEFHVALIHLCAPFVKCVRVEAGMYFAFERLMTMLGE